VNDENASLFIKFNEKPRTDFWIEITQTCPGISMMALKVLSVIPKQGILTWLTWCWGHFNDKYVLTWGHLDTKDVTLKQKSLLQLH